MNKLTLIVDLDSTINYCVEAQLKYLKEKYDLDIVYEEIDNWYGTADQIMKLFSSRNNFFPEEYCRKIADEPFYQKGFFENLEPDLNAIEIINNLYENNWDIIICTKVPFSSLYGYSEKFRWVNKMFPNFKDKEPKFVVTGDKDVIIGDFIVDDSEINISRVFDAGKVKTILLNKPWNRNATKFHFRANNWNEVNQILRKY